jgi:Leucine-rich repeat (LRR) protein
MSIQFYVDSQDENISILYLDGSDLTELPDLSRFTNLRTLWCYDNQLTFLPDNLPDSLIEIYCPYNLITLLPDTLPKNLQVLYCYSNQLTSLPSTLGNLAFLSRFEVYANKNIFGDHPQYDNYRLTKLYPDLHSIDTRLITEQIKYIQQVNTQLGIQQCKEWLNIVNSNNILLELYERKIMNPKNFQYLLQKQENIDSFMERYLRHL